MSPFPRDLLLIEDDPDDAELLRLQLEASDGGGFVLERVGTLEEGVNRLGERTPQAVLLDLTLPDASGMVVLEHVRARAPEVPIVVLTGRPDGASDALARGAQDYLVKGEFSIRELERCLRYARDRMRFELRLREVSAALREANERLARVASTDSLTGLGNRRAFEESLASEWNRASRTGDPLTLMLLDLDHLKAINDRGGHAAGDRALERMASAIRDSARRSGEAAYRIGGDEFAIVLPASTVDDARRVAGSIKELLRGSPGDAPLSASMGIASLPAAPASDCAVLVSAADRALYRMKERGRDGFEVAVRAGG